MRFLPLVVCLVLIAGETSADVTARIATPDSGQDVPPTSRDVVGCPDQGGLLDSVSLPVGGTIGLGVVLQSPAPAGGVRFRLSSDDRNVAAVGDRRQAFLPEVLVPAGATTSNLFTVYGIATGSTLLRATSLTVGFTGITVPLGAWSVGVEGGSPFLDPNRPDSHCRTADDGDQLSLDENVLQACGASARGAVADGVSRLLLRTSAGLNGMSCFEIVSESPLGQGTVETALKSTANVGGLHQASSYYRAPDGLGAAAASRSVELEITYTPAIGNGNTTRVRVQAALVRPPRVLLHGLWSDASAWRKFWIRNDPLHTTFVVDYEADNSDSFSHNIPALLTALGDAVEASRQRGFSTSQADVIGHSMGGLLARLATGHDEYAVPDNLGYGYIHRLLTLATPHFGSSFANLLVALHDTNPEQLRETIEDVAKGNATRGAVCDLAENSPALAELAAGTALPGRVVTATGGPPGTQQTPAEFWGGASIFHVRNFEGALTKTECVDRNIFFQCVEYRSVFPQDVVDGHRFREGNDAIVSASSARGGFDANSGIVTNYPNLLHFAASIVDGVTNTEAVATAALPLLDAELPDAAWAAAFPAVPSNSSGVPRTVPGSPAKDDAAVYLEQCGPGGPMKPNAPELNARAATSQPSQGIAITSPLEGAVFTPGSTVTVVVAVDEELEAVDLKVRVPGFGRVEGTGFDGASFEAEVAIPEAFAGPLTLIPSVTDAVGNRYHGLPVHIAIRPDEPPLELYLIQRTHRLEVGEDATALHAIGVFEGGVERDVTSAAAGTTYESSDTSVVSVDEDGRLTAVAEGSATVTVQLGGLSDFATITVREQAEQLPPIDVSDQLDIRAGGFRVNRNTGFFVQTLHIANPGQLPVAGPLYVVLDGIADEIELISKDCLTQLLAPIGSPYVAVPLLQDGATFGPGEEVDIYLHFLNPERIGIGYAPTIYRTAGNP
jgi:pimeloyl-ACP methyl ester carboxylesterase